MNYFKYITLVIVATYTITTNAQVRNKKTNAPASHTPGTWFVRANVMGLIDLAETNLSVGAEYKLKQKQSLLLDLSYLFFDNTDEFGSSISGIMVRPGYRLYFNNDNKWYVDADVMLKHVRQKKEDWLDINCVNGVSNYSQFRKFTIAKTVIAASAKIGVMARLNKKNTLFLDNFLGFGIRQKNKYLVNEVGNCYNAFDFMSFQSLPSREVLPTLQGGIRLVFKVK